jgi:hypothetical protein
MVLSAKPTAVLETTLTATGDPFAVTVTVAVLKSALGSPNDQRGALMPPTGKRSSGTYPRGGHGMPLGTDAEPPCPNA